MIRAYRLADQQTTLIHIKMEEVQYLLPHEFDGKTCALVSVAGKEFKLAQPHDDFLRNWQALGKLA